MRRRHPARRRSLRLGRRLEHFVVEPDEQHFRVAVEAGERLRLDCEQRLPGVARYGRHLGDRIARRIDAAEAGADEQVADDHVGILRQVRQRQEARAPGAERDAARAGAVHLHRDRVFRVGDQDDLGREGADARDLAEDAVRVDDRLAAEQLRARTLVDEHPLAERVEVDPHDLRDQRALHDARGTLAQRAQPLVLLLERLEAQELQPQHQVVGRELDVLGLDAGLGGKGLAHRGIGLDRRLHGPLDRVGEGCDAVADHREVVLAMVRHHEAGRHGREDDEAEP